MVYQLYAYLHGELSVLKGRNVSKELIIIPWNGDKEITIRYYTYPGTIFLSELHSIDKYLEMVENVDRKQLKRFEYKSGDIMYNISLSSSYKDSLKYLNDYLGGNHNENVTDSFILDQAYIDSLKRDGTILHEEFVKSLFGVNNPKYKDIKSQLDTPEFMEEYIKKAFVPPFNGTRYYKNKELDITLVELISEAMKKNPNEPLEIHVVACGSFMVGKNLASQLSECKLIHYINESLLTDKKSKYYTAYDKKTKKMIIQKEIKGNSNLETIKDFGAGEDYILKISICNMLREFRSFPQRFPHIHEKVSEYLINLLGGSVILIEEDHLCSLLALSEIVKGDVGDVTNILGSDEEVNKSTKKLVIDYVKSNKSELNGAMDSLIIEAIIGI